MDRFWFIEELINKKWPKCDGVGEIVLHEKPQMYLKTELFEEIKYIAPPEVEVDVHEKKDTNSMTKKFNVVQYIQLFFPTKKENKELCIHQLLIKSGEKKRFFPDES